MSITKNNFKKIVGVATVAVLVFSSVAYGNNRDNRLILPSGFAWVDGPLPLPEDFEGSPGPDCYGFIFITNGTFRRISAYSYNYDCSNSKCEWEVNDTGTWSTSGNNRLTLIYEDGFTNTISYTITSTTLTLHGNRGDRVYTRTAVTMP